MERMDTEMRYLSILTINGGMKGDYTLIDALEAGESDTRETLLFRMLGNAALQHGIPVDKAGITYFYLEPLEL